jgi:HEAT repeat protein
MRNLIAVLVLGLGLAASTEALAVQKFIPLGHSSLQQTAEPPKFGSPEADFNLQSDIYETENYLRQREAKEFDNRLRRFLSTPNANTTGVIVDY